MLGYHLKRIPTAGSDVTPFPWRSLAAQLVYRGFWITGVLVAMVLGSYVLERDGAAVFYAFLRRHGGTIEIETAPAILTLVMRLGGWALTAAVLYGSWLRFVRWGQRYRDRILGTAPRPGAVDDII